MGKKKASGEQDIGTGGGLTSIGRMDRRVESNSPEQFRHKDTCRNRYRYRVRYRYRNRWEITIEMHDKLDTPDCPFLAHARLDSRTSRYSNQTLARISQKISGLEYKRAQKILNSNTLHDRLDFLVNSAY